MSEPQFGYRKKTENIWEKVDLATKQVIEELNLSTSIVSSEPKQVVKQKKEEPVSKAEKPEYGKHCHHAGKGVVWASEGREFYAAGFGGIKPGHYDLTIDCGDITNLRRKGEGLVASNDKRFEALNKLEQDTQPSILKIDWKDQSGLPVGINFWKGLWALLPKGTSKTPARIAVCCWGGHGRTGTALSSLLLTSGAKEITSPLIAILTVRANHCEQAVESWTQLNYLDSLASELGMVENAADSMSFGDSGEELAKRQKEVK